jgi:hypothetical protein
LNLLKTKLNNQLINSKIGDNIKVLDITTKDRYREGKIIGMYKNTVDILMFDNGLINNYKWKRIKSVM